MKDFTEPLLRKRFSILRTRRAPTYLPGVASFPHSLLSICWKHTAHETRWCSTLLLAVGQSYTKPAKIHLAAFGYEIAPSAWSFAKLYEFVNVPSKERDETILELQSTIDAEFPIVIFHEPELSIEEIETRTIRIGESLSERAKILLNALVVVLDTYNNRVTSNFVQSKFAALTKLVRGLSYSEQQIKADLQDARSLPLQSRSIDFVVTSPPYINVFNYHQNYRRSVEILGWNLLRVARSEIGSNRANRGNRFYTVIQYCIDMADTLYELARVLQPGGRAVVILGYESRVLGTPFYNADIIERIARATNMFDIVLRQQRVFTNRFGVSIREDVLNLQRVTHRSADRLAATLGRRVAKDALNAALATVPQNNLRLLKDAVVRVDEIAGTPIFNSLSYSEYQTREKVLMVKEKRISYEQ